jgi:phosphoribosylglycinamide formyltransferase 1
VKFGVICSSGGSAFFAAFEMLRDCGLMRPQDVLILTDRICGAEVAARSFAIETHRVARPDNAAFSEAAAIRFSQSECSHCLLLFSRLVTTDLFSALPTYNIHPSLLPAFRGFGAISQASRAGVTMVGTTLHEVDADADTGRICAQVTSPREPATSVETLHRISFVHRVYLILVLFERCSGAQGRRVTPSASPALSTPVLVEAFRTFLASRPETVFAP